MSDESTPNTPSEFGIDPSEEAQRAKDKQKERELINLETKRREENLKNDTKELFKHVHDYLLSELQVTNEDFKCLENMNYVVAEKYSSMNEHAQALVKQMSELQEKYLSYLPYLQKIDEIDASLVEFEKTVALLDDYTQKLESKFLYLKEARKQPYRKDNTHIDI